MADKPVSRSFELTVLETEWLKQCIMLQRAALTRSRNKEMSQSEIYHLRTKEIEFLTALSGRF